MPAQKGKKTNKAGAKQSNAGRPSSFTNELADELCERLCEGESLRAICKSEDMPSRATVFRWLNENEQFQDQYARAKEEQAEALADDIISIADQYDQLKEKLEGGTDHIQRAKLRIDARKWVASKLKPKKYGDKVVSEVVGKDGGEIKTQTTVIIDDKTIESALAKIKGI